jgi:hypothetical protein
VSSRRAVAEASVFAAYDVPIRLARTLRGSIRRAARRRRLGLVPGCALLGLRAKRGGTPAGARTAYALPWRLPHSGSEPGAPSASQRVVARQAGSRMTVVSSPSAKTSITAFAWLPDWSRLPRNAARRSRRRSAQALVVPSQIVQRVSSVGASRRSDEVARAGTLRHEIHARTLESRRAELVGAPRRLPQIASSADITSGPRPRDATGTDGRVLPPTAQPRPDRAPSQSWMPDLTPLTLGLVAFPHPPRSRWVSPPAASSPTASRSMREIPGHGTHPDAAGGGHHLIWRPTTLATVWTRVSEIVEKEINRHLPASDAPPAAAPAAAPRAAEVAAPPAVAITDRLVVQLMTRMRALAREERFRAGQLR